MSSKTGVISLISALLLVPACLVFFFLMKPDPLSLKLTGSEAEQIARDYVQKVGLNDPGLKICIRKLKTDTNDQANQCILDKLGKEKLRKTFEQVWSPQTWWIRFCGEQQIKEILVKVDASRKAVVGLTLKLPDSDAGARLSKEDALKKIGKFLQDYHSDLQPFKLVGSKSFEREHRSDHTTQWECTKTGIGCSDVKLRMECSTIGDVVSGYNPYWELPDKWSFSYQEITIRRGTAILGFLLQLLAAVILTIIWLLKVPKTSAPGFRYIVKFIAVVAGLSVLLKALMGSTLMANYDSQTPYLASVLQTICYQATENVPLLCMLGMAIVLASDAGAQFVPGDKNRADGENLPARLLNSEFLRTTISMGYSIGALAVFAFGSALHFVAEYSTEAVVNSYDLAAFLSEAYSPGTFAIVLALLAAILSVPILGVVYGFLKRFLDKPMPFYIMAAFLSFSIAGMTRHSHDVLLLGVLFFAGIAVLRCLIYKVFCGNPICLSVSVFVFVILGAVSQFLMLGRALLLSDAYICLASLVLFPAIAWIIGNRAREHAPPATH